MMRNAGQQIQFKAPVCFGHRDALNAETRRTGAIPPSKTPAGRRVSSASFLRARRANSTTDSLNLICSAVNEKSMFSLPLSQEK
jgi:hypothetical protein